MPAAVQAIGFHFPWRDFVSVMVLVLLQMGLDIMAAPGFESKSLKRFHYVTVN